MPRFRDLVTAATGTFDSFVSGIKSRFTSALGYVASGVGRFVASADESSAQATNTLDAMSPTEFEDFRDREIAELTSRTRNNLREALSRYSLGHQNRDQLQSDVQSILRVSSFSAAVIAVGGIENLSENVLETVQRGLTRQFDYLDGFINDLEKVSDIGKAQSRLSRYAQSTNAAAAQALRQYTLDFQNDINAQFEERRRLGSGKNCEDCIALAAIGWVDAGELPAIGQETVCQDNCGCSFEYRPKSDTSSGEDTSEV